MAAIQTKVDTRVHFIVLWALPEIPRLVNLGYGALGRTLCVFFQVYINGMQRQRLLAGKE
jgi:hypothetical protein